METSIKNTIVYLVVSWEDDKRLSAYEVHKLYDDYKNDSESVVEESLSSTAFYVTTNLYNVLTKHSVLDLRFNVGYRTSHHHSDYHLPKNSPQTIRLGDDASHTETAPKTQEGKPELRQAPKQRKKTQSETIYNVSEGRVSPYVDGDPNVETDIQTAGTNKRRGRKKKNYPYLIELLENQSMKVSDIYRICKEHGEDVSYSTILRMYNEAHPEKKQIKQNIV